MRSLVCLVVALLLRAATSSADVWHEATDAASFPDGVAQRTLHRGYLGALIGATAPALGDSRDAFVIRIADPAGFSVAVTADFAAQILLFTPDGSPLSAGRGWSPAAGQEAPASFVAAFTPPRPGEYVLVVTSAGNDPHDAFARSLFLAGDGPERPPAADASAFDHWSGSARSGGSYVLGLEGAEGAGFLDVVLAVDEVEMDRYCLGTDTEGDFHCHGVSGDEVQTYDVELGDFDNDGELDAVFATTSVAERNRICPGDAVGRFSFSDCIEFGPTGLSSRGVAIGHVDMDANLDVVFATDNSGNLSCLGDGALGFACVEMEAAVSHSRHVALGHLDGDGFLDAVVGNTMALNRSCLGAGDGTFTSCADVGSVNGRGGLVLGELTGDADLDLVYVTRDDAFLCPGDGTGTFSQCTVFTVALSANFVAVAAGFLDADSNLDLFLLQTSTRQQVCLGDATGSFACDSVGCLPNTSRHNTEVALADFNGDGALDAAMSADPQAGEVWFGDGNGAFAVCAQLNERREAQGLAVGALAPASLGWDDFETGDLRAWADSEPE